MNRRGFLKSGAALAVASAFPLPAPATPAGLDAAFLQAFSAAVTNEFWLRGTCRPDIGLASATFMEEMRSLLKRAP
jgi:hypothetical protein